MPIDFARLPEGAEATIRASTAACLIGHALAFSRLQHTAGMLSPAPAPLKLIYDLAARKKDTALVYVISMCTPLYSAVMDICNEAENVFVQRRFAREEALALAAQTPNAVEDVGGLYVDSALIIKSNEPAKLIAAAAVRRHTTLWKPPNKTMSAAEFVTVLDTELPNIDNLIAALHTLLQTTDDTLAARIHERVLRSPDI